MCLSAEAKTEAENISVPFRQGIQCCVPHTYSGHADNDNVGEALDLMSHSICGGQFPLILLAN